MPIDTQLITGHSPKQQVLQGDLILHDMITHGQTLPGLNQHAATAHLDAITHAAATKH